MSRNPPGAPTRAPP